MTLLVATFVAHPEKSALTPALIAGGAQALGLKGETRWLAAHQAADFVFESATPARALADALRGSVEPYSIDVIVQPLAGRRKKLFLADMDSTMIAQECIDELADFVGLKTEVSAITERAMRGELAFEPALRERVALLQGLGIDVIEQILAERIQYTPGGDVLVRTMRAHGAYTALVSGGFTLFTGPVSQKIGFHEHRSNELLVEAGRLVGRVAEPILGKEAKLASLQDLARINQLHMQETMAVGDGANDLAMLQAAGLGIAFHAKPAVAEAAAARIDYTDLTTLLYAQGYEQKDFVTTLEQR
jgi:phosphoserine phosphatase